MQNKTIILAVVIVAVGALVTLFYYKNPSCSDGHLCLRVFGNPPWKLAEIYESTDTNWRGIFSSGPSFIQVHQISKISPSDAEMLTKARLAQIESQYEPERSPYPGVISGVVACPPKYMPSFLDGTLPSKIAYRSFSSYANDRLQYGSCTEQQAQYGAETVLFYCQNLKRWYEVEVFTPIKFYSRDEVFQSFFNRFICNS